MGKKQLTIFNYFIIVLMLSVPAACSTQQTSPRSYAWIDVPVNGLKVPENTVVQIEGHAAHPGGINHVELFVDAAQIAVLEDLEQDDGLARFDFEWLPPAAGEYLIQAIAFDTNGSSGEPDQALVIVGEAAPEELKEAEEPTPTTPPDVVINFWADPAEINAGDCTKIKWHVENVKSVVFGGVDQKFDGSFGACLCDDELYSLRTTLNDGTEDVRNVSVKVNGTCAATEPEEEPPTADNTAPPAPTLAVPASGLTLSCRSYQALNWLPVSDPSGIEGYYVQVQRHSGDNNWKDINGSIFSNIQGKSKEISVECGWYYRWRVQAKDNANNVSSWSGWSTFTVTLG